MSRLFPRISTRTYQNVVAGIQEVRRPVGNRSAAAQPWTSTFAARNFYVPLEEEQVGGAVAVNDALAPHWLVLWRAAARGQYLVRGQPIREIDREPVYRQPTSTATEQNAEAEAELFAALDADDDEEEGEETL